MVSPEYQQQLDALPGVLGFPGREFPEPHPMHCEAIYKVAAATGKSILVETGIIYDELPITHQMYGAREVRRDQEVPRE